MGQKTDKYQDLKFLIEEKLDSLPYSQRKEALQILPAMLDISRLTFYKYRTIRRDENQDIPSTKLATLAGYFNCKVEDLINISIDVSHIENVDPAPKTAGQFGLTR
jgi:hypothetical protein